MLYNRVKVATVTTGMANPILGAALSGYQTPTQAGVVSGEWVSYIIEDGANWEIGTGPYDAPSGQLTRWLPHQSSSGMGVSISLSGNAVVYIGATAAHVAKRRNRLVNPAMQISQQWVGGWISATTSPLYPVDQWWVAASSDGLAQTVQYNDPAALQGGQQRLHMIISTADTSIGATQYLSIAQDIEGNDVADFAWGTANARPATLRFGIKAPAGTWAVSIGNSDLSRCFVADVVISAGEANLGVIRIIPIPGDTAGTWLKNNGVGIQVRFNFAMGSSWRGVAGWQAGPKLATASTSNGMASTSNIFEIWDVGFYLGLGAPVFEMPDFGDELLRCQRFYQKTYSLGVSPATLTHDGARAKMAVAGPTIGECDWTLPVKMRGPPTFTAYSPGTGAAGYVKLSGGPDMAVSGNVSGDHYIAMSGTISGALQFVYSQFVANARLA